MKCRNSVLKLWGGNLYFLVLLTNHRKLGPVELVTRYAQRMLIENGISEAVQLTRAALG